ncbi:MAG: phosphatidylserine/phosphatidylglycerophosphate/cardiolipin synthase family protein [Myxococcota bacterium]|nr:phosphatidylserine/phosphatidylglycerophosphate/cardiolipin synthase family protein [Myxococcota bacterium]
MPLISTNTVSPNSPATCSPAVTPNGPVTCPPLATDSFSANGERSSSVVPFKERFIANLLEARTEAKSGQSPKLAALTQLSETQIRELVNQVEASCTRPVKGSKVIELFNAIKMKQLHHTKPTPAQVIEFLYHHSAYQSDAATSSSSPAWTRELISDPSLGEFKVDAFARNFKAWTTGEEKVTIQDLGLNFQETENNKIEVFSDKGEFWPALMKDLDNAQDSVNINMFGLMGDPWGKEVFELLIEKAKKGVKVRVLADQLGARMHWYFEHANADFIDYLRDNDIEVILTSDPDYYGNFHFDHRKFYVIDGQLGHNTGYTIEDHMRHIHFDIGMRIQGDMVKQLQASFFASWLYFGGELKDKDGAFDYEQFYKRYFPTNAVTGDTTARLISNIPNVQHRVTETYYDSIRAAQTRVQVINEFLSDNELIKILEEKANEGVEVEIVFPRVFEWEGYGLIAAEFFDRIHHLPNVKIHIYDGPEDHGWLHTKGILVDNTYVNFGSTNMDELALFHNYEVNVELSDPSVAQEVNEEVFEYAIKYSKPYESTPSWGKSIKTFFYKLIKKTLEP